MLKCSAIGPNAKAGKNVRAPIIKIIKNNINENTKLSVLKVELVIGTDCFLYIEYPTTTINAILIYLPKNITIPVVIFQKVVPSPNPSNPDPLFAALEVYSYST